jgi:hypothetical protein
VASSSGAAGPVTHYAFFAGLRDRGVAHLVTGATALVLHGVPRLTPDIDLLVDAGPANIERLGSLLAAWGDGEPEPPAAAAAPRRFRSAQSALGEIDAIPLAPAAFARLQAGSVVVTLVDVGIPVVGAADLLALKAESADAADREDAQALSVLASIRAGEAGSSDDTRREQIRKFSRWSVAARLDWLLASARLAMGLAPEAKPMTRGLVRRRPWTEPRGRG